MLLHRRSISWGMLCCAVSSVWLAGWLPGQDPAGGDPFGDSKPAAAPAAPAKKKAAEDVKVESDPVVIGIRESKPTSATELMQAAINVINYGRADEAKRYLTALQGLGLDGEQCWRLQRRFGSAPLLRMTLQEDLQPEGKQFADTVRTNTQKFIHDPARIAQLIERLGSEQPDERRAALTDLREAEANAAVALIGILGDGAREGEHARVRATLQALGSISVEPLLASLEVPDEAWRSQVVMVLASLGRSEAVPFLLRPYFNAEPDSPQKQAATQAISQLLRTPPTRTSAEQYLFRELREFFRGRVPGKIDEHGEVHLWRWDAEQRRPVEMRLSPEAASLLFASRLGAELTALSPGNREYRVWQLAALLESAKLATGWEQPLPSGGGSARDFASTQIDLMEDVLRLGLEESHPGAAVAALEMIGGSENPKWLESSSGQPREVVLALHHSNRRVRFAALQAVVQLAPPQSFAGASYVPETLAYFVRSSGSRRVLIAHPRVGDAQTIAGSLRDMGLEADLFVLGRQAFQAARRDADYEFVLLSDALDQPDVLEQIQQFRREPTTSRIPIGVLARSERFQQLERRLVSDPLTQVYYQPGDAAGIQFVSSQLLGRIDPNFVMHAERLRQAGQALGWWSSLAERPEWFGYYEFLPQQKAAERALDSLPLAVSAAKVLGLLGDAPSQRALLVVVNDRGRTLPARQAAATGFAEALKRRGLMLTRAEILRQYNLYNQSATADPGTQAVLGAVLDAIENPTAMVAAATSQAPEEKAK